MNKQKFKKYLLDTFYDYYRDTKFGCHKKDDVYQIITKGDIHINTTEKILVIENEYNYYILDISRQLDYFIRKERDRKLNDLDIN